MRSRWASIRRRASSATRSGAGWRWPRRTVETPPLPPQSDWERMLADYRTTGLSVGMHPLELLRPHLPPGTLSSRELLEVPHGRRVAVAGMTIARQRPTTANGVVFMLIED